MLRIFEPFRKLKQYTAIESILLVLWGCSTKPLQVQNNSLCRVSCPRDLGELRNDTFGATSEKLLEVIGVYRQCRKACIQE